VTQFPASFENIEGQAVMQVVLLCDVSALAFLNGVEYRNADAHINSDMHHTRVEIW